MVNYILLFDFNICIGSDVDRLCGDGGERGSGEALGNLIIQIKTQAHNPNSIFRSSDSLYLKIPQKRL